MSIIIGITQFGHEPEVFFINIVFWVDSVVTIIIIVSNGFKGNLIEFVTVPSIWAFTITFIW